MEAAACLFQRRDQGLRPRVEAQNAVWTQRALQGTVVAGPAQAYRGSPLEDSSLTTTPPCPRSGCSVCSPVHLGVLLVTLDGPAAEDRWEQEAGKPRLCSDPGLWGVHNEDPAGGGGAACLVWGCHGLGPSSALQGAHWMC